MGLIDNGSVSYRDPSFYTQKRKAEIKIGRKLSREEFIKDYYIPSEDAGKMASTGTSIFDPALCETMYIWFTKENDLILDPFAGGSVRGIVAVETGRHYIGVDLRQEQVDANNINAEEICNGEKPKWICGDSVSIKTLAGGEYDFIMTCPPYGDLEVYSDNPADISNMSEEEFDETYTKILYNSVEMLKDNRFACIVVGNYRDKKGNLRDLVGLTVKAMEKAGAHYYNDIIYITPAGSLPVRVGKSFTSTRKVGRQHQYCLIFVKGDGKTATERLGEVELPDLEELYEEQI